MEGENGTASKWNSTADNIHFSRSGPPLYLSNWIVAAISWSRYLLPRKEFFHFWSFRFYIVKTFMSINNPKSCQRSLWTTPNMKNEWKKTCQDHVLCVFFIYASSLYSHWISATSIRKPTKCQIIKSFCPKTVTSIFSGLKLCNWVYFNCAAAIVSGKLAIAVLAKD